MGDIGTPVLQVRALRVGDFEFANVDRERGFLQSIVLLVIKSLKERSVEAFRIRLIAVCEDVQRVEPLLYGSLTPGAFEFCLGAMGDEGQDTLEPEKGEA